MQELRNHEIYPFLVSEMKAQKPVALQAVLQGSWEELPQQLKMDPDLLRAKEMGTVPLDVPETCPDRVVWCHLNKIEGFSAFFDLGF